MTFKIRLWHVVLASGVAITSHQRWTTLLHMRTLYRSGILLRSRHHVLCDGGVVCCWAALDFTDRQTDRGRAADSCMLGCRTRRLRERECKTCRDEQREIGFLSVSPHQFRRDLTHCGLVHLSYLPPYLFLSLLLRLSPLSLFHLLAIFPPSLSFGVHPNHTPLQQAQECVCVSLCTRACVFKKDHFHVRCLPK